MQRLFAERNQQDGAWLLNSRGGSIRCNPPVVARVGSHKMATNLR